MGTDTQHRPAVRWRARLAAAVGCAVVAAIGLAQPAAAALEVTSFGGAARSTDGAPLLQAGAHPDVSTRIAFEQETRGFYQVPVEQARTVEVDLPPGLVGAPKQLAECSERDLGGPEWQGTSSVCSKESQVGTITPEGVFGAMGAVPLYNMEPPPGAPAMFAANIIGNIVRLVPGVRVGPDGYRVVVDSRNVSQGLNLNAVSVTIWGVPADPSHDAERMGGNGFGPSAAPRVPLISNPTSCGATPSEVRMRADSWEVPGVFDSASFTEDFDGNPLVNTACELLAFDPSMAVQPTDRRAGGPAGLDVSIEVPQSQNPDGLATAHVKKVEVTFPEGMRVNPSSADGLQACGSAQIGLDDNAQPTCPAASKIGSIDIETPLIEAPLTGGVYLAKQSDNKFGSLIALYIVAKGPGVLVKLPGLVELDPRTGRLKATFDDNPQLPFESMTVRLNGGPRAPLTLPADCGPKTTRAVLTPWSGATPVTVDSSFEVSRDGSGEPCGPQGFAPAFEAGSTDPVGGRYSPFRVGFERGDADQELGGVSVELPEGLLARIASSGRCSDAQAAAGSCGEESRIGSVTTAAGSGSNPFSLPGRVYLTGPYRGAPFGLSIVVPAVAGPFDLGTVVVRAAIEVDPVTAAVKVVSDPLPTILEGIPLQIRLVDVVVDRPGFVVNPTSCDQAAVRARLSSVAPGSQPAMAGRIGYAASTGAVAELSRRFQVAGCSDLGFTPRLAMRMAGRKQTRTGGHPALRAVLTQGAGQSNIGAAKVVLPPSVALDAVNSADPKLLCGYDEGLAAACPASSVIGKATARTPVLDRPLSGDVHLVQGIKIGKDGRRVRTLPTLLVKLRGEVAIDLRAKTSTTGDDRLVTTFPAVPDAPVSRFAMNIAGGKKGILVVTRTKRSRIDICASKQVAKVETDGHSGKTADYSTTIKAPCSKRKTGKAKRGGAKR